MTNKYDDPTPSKGMLDALSQAKQIFESDAVNRWAKTTDTAAEAGKMLRGSIYYDEEHNMYVASPEDIEAYDEAIKKIEQ